MTSWFRVALKVSCLVTVCSGQVPSITPGGVVTGAAYTKTISPGALVSVFGTNLAPSAVTASSYPLLTSLNGVSVTINGLKAPLFYVSPTQINLQVPSELESSLPDILTQTFEVIVTTPAGASSPAPVPATFVSPALFTQDGSGCGAVAALNVAPNGALSLNSASNSAAPGDTVAIFATGLGGGAGVLYPQVPPDGTPPTVLTTFFGGSGVLFDNTIATGYPFEGLAPGLVAVDQINVQIPPGTREGCAIPTTLVSGVFASLTGTISIHSGRGQCVNPPVQSYGSVTLSRIVSSGTSSDGEVDMFSANFPAAPGLPAPVVQSVVPSGSVQLGESYIAPSRSCALEGYQELSAGPIQIQPPNGSSLQINPQATASGVSYQQTLPQSFVAPGQYKISATGSPVGLSGALAVGSPIQVQTNLATGTTIDISSCNTFVINWTGGDPGTLVRVTLRSLTQNVPNYAYGEADASVGSIAFQPVCDRGASPTLGVTGGPIEAIVEVSPYPSNFTTLTSSATTGSVTATWKYRYVFDGLTLQQ